MNTKYQHKYQYKYEEEWQSKEKRRTKAGNQYNDGTFIYSWKSETNSWIIGDTSRSGTAANAIYNGDYRKCPDEIVFKGRFNPRENGGNNVGSSESESSEVKEGPVEEVGRYAFSYCGYYSNTRKVVVPKEVKIIREYGFCNMHKVTNFTIEIGSQLESIEYAGLHYIGYDLNDRTDSGSFSPGLKNLILPHTLKSVCVNGIYCCNRFTRIIYCGNHNLNINSSTLSNKGDYTKVYITPEYQTKNGNSIFKRAATGVLSEDEIDISCYGMLPPTPGKWDITEVNGDVIINGRRSGVGRCPTGGIEIPVQVDGRTVVGVSDAAFENCRVGGRISLAQTVRTVGARAFANTSDVKEVLLPMRLDSIGKGAFEDCRGVHGDLGLVLPSSANISDGAFQRSDFSEVMFSYDGNVNGTGTEDEGNSGAALAG